MSEEVFAIEGVLNGIGGGLIVIYRPWACFEEFEDPNILFGVRRPAKILVWLLWGNVKEVVALEEILGEQMRWDGVRELGRGRDILEKDVHDVG